jgi:hypothetical protein
MLNQNSKSDVKLQITLVLLILFSVSGHSQSEAIINKVDFTLSKENMVITYDITKYRKNERFSVSMKLISENGAVIIPQSVGGDIGNNITGGKGKTVIWNIRKDVVVMDQNVAVEVIAVPEPYQPIYFSKGKAVLLSAVIPGLGINKLQEGGAYWLFSVGVYGCLAGSAVFYQNAENTYKKYEASMITIDRNNLYSTVQDQKELSKNLLFAAGALWIGNIIWTLATPNRTKTDKKKPSFTTFYDPLAGSACINIRIGL